MSFASNFNEVILRGGSLIFAQTKIIFMMTAVLLQRKLRKFLKFWGFPENLKRPQYHCFMNIENYGLCL